MKTERGSPLSVVDSTHEYFDRLCAMAAANQTSSDENRRLAAHVQSCLVCKQALEQYQQLVGQIYEEALAVQPSTEWAHAAADEASEQSGAKERFLRTIRRTIESPLCEDQLGTVDREKTANRLFTLPRVPAWASCTLAAALLVAVFADVSQYLVSKRHTRDADVQSASFQKRLEELRGELSRLQPKRDETGAKVQPQEGNTEAQRLKQENEALQRRLAGNEVSRHHEDGEYSELQDRVRMLQSSLEVLQQSNSSLDVERSGLAEKVSTMTADLRKSQDEIARLAARNDELSQESLAQVRSAERQQKLLATDHDIRDILGARSLHIIDVYDVSSQGEFERPFGRIFYTEGKSLIFYAFDLDQQKGLKRGTVFQAWGQKGEGKEDPRNLGSFYMDDASQNRWILKVDDSKVLSRIDFVFVTDGSRKEGPRPKGKPLLSAFLNSTANHP
jgi:hypothetical protein